MIPKVVEVVESRRPDTARPWVPPEACPVCGTPAVKPEGEVDRRCPNSSCPAQIEERLKHFAGRVPVHIQRAELDYGMSPPGPGGSPVPTTGAARLKRSL